MYKLKKNMENFQVVDGPLAGRKYVRGKEYSEVPAEERHRFEKKEKLKDTSSKIQAQSSKIKDKE